ncbi:hypothetical protein Bhyg_10361 [Pseudolycoriella hygida]|uniref:Osiris 6 n=1 Tax=Pseudolycoriella hygida TaxID=35572 RepID=A0A9Q0MTD1_9DIPT|nr:hypothetical protein Bhyg_10361 [Pseudolycoriella hygida]
MKIFIVTCLLISAVFAADEPSSFQDCLEKDSISCVQVAVFRKAKSFFDQPTISLFGGLSLAKSERAGKSLEEPTIEIESANTVETRENALESYVVNRAKNFFQERSLSWDFASTARTLSNAIPDDIKESVRSLIVEERGKKKKILKKLLPLLGLLKVKFAVFGVFALFAIAIIAKKALLLAIISIAISGASVVQGLFSKLRGLGSGFGGLGGGSSGGYSGGYSGGHGGHEEIIAYTNGGSGGGWSSGGGGSGGWSSGGYDSYGEHGSHSSPVGQAIAYSGHHKVARR